MDPLIQLVELDKFPHLLDQTVALVNSEWPRSTEARISSLSKSLKEYGPDSTAFPVSLVLVSGNLQSDVIGHGRLLLLHNKNNACYVESVVVAKTERGKGYGKLIMLEAEKYAGRHGMDEIYLITKDQQNFYLHLGYSYCHPVTFSASSSRSIQEKCQMLTQRMSAFPEREIVISGGTVCTNLNLEMSTIRRSNNNSIVLPPSMPPPPPPLPIISSDSSSSTIFQSDTKTYYMRKQITNQ